MHLVEIMEKFQGKNKARPTRAELVRLIDQILWNCVCDVDGHTIREEVNGYTYIITRQLAKGKAKY